MSEKSHSKINRYTVAVAMSTFNDTHRAVLAVKSIFESNTRAYVKAVVVDDGSEQDTVDALAALAEEYEHLTFIPRPHRERGFARHEAIQEALNLKPDFMLFMDADMILETGAIQYCIQSIEDTKAGAVVVREVPFSDCSNFATKVKVFERHILNNSQMEMTEDSIEAARFWTTQAWEESGGLNPSQIAFEEIQPTIRYMKKGGKIARCRRAKMHHDEKEVTFDNLFGKKAYYFGQMHKTANSEENGVKEMIKRWYPFRKVYYEEQNVREYIKHPILAAGMVGMYAGLTGIAVKNLGVNLIKNRGK